MYLAFTREDVPLVEFMYLAFVCIPGESTEGDSVACCCTCVTEFVY